MIDAATIRERLAACKEQCLPWDEAWRSAVGIVPPGPRNGRGEDLSAARFAFEQFRAHYLGEDRTRNALSADLTDEARP